MARRWTIPEEKFYRTQLHELYVIQNLPIEKIAKKLCIGNSTVYDRMIRLGITPTPERKPNYLKKRKDIRIPARYTADLAEFFGIMLGDGNLTKSQIKVTLGTKEMKYAKYITLLFKNIFGPTPKIAIRKSEYKDVYIGSVDLVRWLQNEGLIFNKVSKQVSAPKWINGSDIYQKRFLRGFFDTDGSIYKLRYGHQISFRNESIPLLLSLQDALKQLHYKPSEITCGKIYLTRKDDIVRFFREISPKNPKHLERFRKFCVDDRVVKCSAL